jgi:hypothetical protein
MAVFRGRQKFTNHDICRIPDRRYRLRDAPILRYPQSYTLVLLPCPLEGVVDCAVFFFHRCRL